MSLTQRLKQGFLRLPSAKKLILVSSFTLAVSTVMPWYDQRNNFGVGDTFLGIQGPLFAVGFLVLGCALVSFSNLFLPLMGRHFFDLKRQSGSLALSLGGLSLLLILVANSVFYHPEFAVTINNKGTRFGMVAAFISIGALMISGWWVRRKEKAGGGMEDRENELEDFMATPVAPAPMPSYSVPTPSYVVPVQDRIPQPQVQPAPQAQVPVDPLTLDARTRYKMMKSQGHYSSSARNNLWGSGSGSAFGRQARIEEDL
ncbi:MAG: hypothetical protein WC777_01445 [Candidatus Gracilibacteria bacterium]|jgi:hypothetical protein